MVKNVNHIYSKNKKVIKILSFLLLLLLLCGSEGYLNGTQHDLIFYKGQYDGTRVLFDNDFFLYYFFYICRFIGQSLNLPFADWWTIMSVLSLLVIIFAIKIHDYNDHLLIIWFLLYFFTFYTGLKMYYGTCLYLLAYGYLKKGGVGNRIKYVVLTLLAAGMHCLFYAFLIMLVANYKIKKGIRKVDLIRLFVGGVVSFSFILKITGTVGLLSEILSLVNIDKISYYLSFSTGKGMLIPIGLHLLTLYAVKKYYKKIRDLDEDDRKIKEILYQTTLLAFLFYPMFMFSTTFGRWITVLSFVVLVSMGYRSEMRQKKDRLATLQYGLIVVCGYYIKTFVISDGWKSYIVPLLDFRFF